ncbi:histone H2B, gonadal [Trichuris trichiura]|uniref:Histone H2B, gonadal n=1 Tax=Trichuris trichiura TaxID=36087 RepID=A0A077Z6F8_TRITR|nr:histone H2B, gonadal [Trichuris trichiura]
MTRGRLIAAAQKVKKFADKKKRESHKRSFVTTIYKVLKQVHPDLGISTRAISIMDCFVNDVLEHKKKRKSDKGSFVTTIYKVLKEVHPYLGMSTRAISIMDCFVIDVFERIAAEAFRLALYNNRNTISLREIESAVCPLLPGEPTQHGVSEETKAVTKCTIAFLYSRNKSSHCDDASAPCFETSFYLKLLPA